MIAHVGFVRDGWPVVLPFHYGLADLGDGQDEQLVIHGSAGGRAFLDAAGDKGVRVSVAVTLNDGLVLGRSAYDTGAHYRCVVAYGYARLVPPELRPLALDRLLDHIVPGRRAEVRASTPKEIAATALLAIPLDHASAKVAVTSTGETPGDGEDRRVWAGVVPFSQRAGGPVAAPETEFPDDLPPSVRALLA
jgi:nitroimidazol reductase NimA-like FMN-containing flavoprotein (pyridoxamine 5'-phosphate oxidase superfamily)